MSRHWTATATAVVVTWTGVGTSLPAQTAEAWLGAPLPGALALPPSLSVLDDPDFGAPPASVPADDTPAPELAGERIRGWLEVIVGFSTESRSEGQLMWGRVSGFPTAAATADWVSEQFRDAGLRDVAVQGYEADADMWWPDHWEVRLLGSPSLGVGTDDVLLRSATPARDARVPDRSLTAQVVYVGDVGSARDADVRGKVAVQRLRPSSGAFSQRAAIREGAADLFGRGAAAVLNYIDQPGNMHVRDFSGCAVCFNIGGADGAFLRDVAERAAAVGLAGEVRMRLYLDSGTRSGLTAQNVVGVVPGESPEVIIVNAHLDGWYDAAGDNGDGLAVLIGLARHFAAAERRPARTLAFVASGGHHSQGLNGPQSVVSANPELARRAVLVLNLEHVAQYLVDPDSWKVERTEQPMGWGVTNMAPYLLDLTDRGVERYGFRLRPEYGSGVPGDLGRYAPLGVPRVQAIHAGPLYHTSGDVLQTISVEGLERAARFFAHFIDGVARATRAQIDP